MPNPIQIPPRNPLIFPPDEVLRAAVALENDPAFRSILTWISACWASTLNRLPNIKDDLDYRWAQGQTQALLIVMNFLNAPRGEIEKREAKAREDALPRNA